MRVCSRFQLYFVVSDLQLSRGRFEQHDISSIAIRIPLVWLRAASHPTREKGTAPGVIARTHLSIELAFAPRG